MKQSDFILYSIKIIDIRAEKTFSDGSYTLLYELRSLLRILLELETDTDFEEEPIFISNLYVNQNLNIIKKRKPKDMYKYYTPDILEEYQFHKIFGKNCLDVGCYRIVPLVFD